MPGCRARQRKIVALFLDVDFTMAENRGLVCVVIRRWIRADIAAIF
jgi:hypothetical protein